MDNNIPPEVAELYGVAVDEHGNLIPEPKLKRKQKRKRSDVGKKIGKVTVEVLKVVALSLMDLAVKRIRRGR